MTARPRWHEYAAAARGEAAGVSRSDRSHAGNARAFVRVYLFSMVRRMWSVRKAPAGETDDGNGGPRMDIRLAVAALMGWLAVFALLHASTGVSLAAAGFSSGTALVLAGWFLLRRRQGKQRALIGGTALLLLCLLALLSLITGVRLAERLTGPIAAAIESSAYVGVELEALSDASRSRTPSRFGGERYLVSARIAYATSGGKRFEAATPVLVLGSAAWKSVRYADRIRAAGTLAPSEPGSVEQALLSASTAPAITGRPAPAEAINGMRSDFIAMTEPLPEDARGLLPGMAFGDREQQTDELAEAMRRTGLTHLLAVSGANCSYLLGFVYLLVRSCRLPRWYAAAAGIVALVGFVMLVRPEPSVLRAAVMGAVGVAALLTGRQRSSLAFLSLAVLLLLIADPWLAVEYSFILSALATLGLVMFGAKCSRWLQRWLPRMLADALAVPLAAQVFCTPVLVLLQPELALYSIPANILAAPVVPLVTITAMAALGLLPVLPAAAGWLVGAAGLPTIWVAWIARTFSQLPLATLPWFQGTAGSVAAAVAGGCLLMMLWFAAGRSAPRVERPATPDHAAGGWQISIAGTVSRVLQKAHGRRGGTTGALRSCRSRTRPGRRAGITRLALWTLAPAVAAGSAAGWLAGPPAGTASEDGWDVAVCDVGQGDGIAIRTGPSSAMVIDAGPDPGSMDRCLDRLGVDTIGLLVLTHMHLDHYGGLPGVFEGREVGSVLLGSAKPELPAAAAEEFRRQGVTPLRGATGQSGTEGPASWQVLWPVDGMSGRSENDSSVVLLVEIRGADGAALRLLLTGDLEAEAAADMLRRIGDPVPAVDLLKISHHGARNGGTEIIERLRPKAALISVGADNDYGHPAPKILSVLQRLGIPAFRTDQAGTVLVDLRDGRMAVRRL